MHILIKYIILIILSFNCEANSIIKAYQGTESIVVIPLNLNNSINTNKIELCNLDKTFCKKAKLKLDSGIIFDFSLSKNSDVFLLLVNKEKEEETLKIIERVIPNRKTSIDGAIEKISYILVGLIVSLIGYFFRNNFERKQQEKRDMQLYALHAERVKIELNSGADLKPLLSYSSLFPEHLNIPYSLPKKTLTNMLKLISEFNQFSEQQVSSQNRTEYVERYCQCIKKIVPE